jgi:hypothetical protein
MEPFTKESFQDVGPSAGYSRAAGAKAQAAQTQSPSVPNNSNPKTRRPRRILGVNTTPTGNFQFLREETYAISPMGRAPKAGVRQPPKNPIFDVLNEAGRLSVEGCRHLVSQGLEPLPPVTLYGVEPEGLMPWLYGHMQAAKKHRVIQRRKTSDVEKTQPSNIPTMLGVVASFPGAPDDRDPRYVRWKGLVRDWALRHYGEANVVSVLEHTDEPHGHVHILVATPNADRAIPLSMGLAAEYEVRKRGGTGTEAIAARHEGFRKLQDEFHAAVGAPVGLQRKAETPALRYSYEEHKVRKQLAAEVADEEARLAGKEAAVHRQREHVQALEIQATAMELAMRKALERQEAELERMEYRLYVREQEIVRREDALKAEHARIEQQRKTLTEQSETALREQAKAASESARVSTAKHTAINLIQGVREWIQAKVQAADLSAMEGRELMQSLGLHLESINKNMGTPR